MDPGDWISLAAFLLTVAAGLVAYGSERRRISDLEKAREEDRAAAAKQREQDLGYAREQMGELRSRIEVAERAAVSTEALTRSVEHLATQMESGFSHMTETFGLKLGHLSERVDGLAHDYKNVKQVVLAPPRARTRKAQA